MRYHCQERPVSESDCELLKPNTLIISPLYLAVMRKNIPGENDGEKVAALSFENLKDDSGHNPIVQDMVKLPAVPLC